MISTQSAAHTAAGFPAINRYWLRVARWDPGELFSRALVGGLFLALSIRIGADFVRTQRPTGLLLLASESLVVLLTATRRRAILVDRSWNARGVTALSLAGPLLVRPGEAFAWLPEMQAVILFGCGLFVIVAGKISLGRSFGLVPANRGIVCRGIYGFVRHPIYVGYLITHGAFLLSHLGAWNACVLVASDTMLVVRALYEERTLSRDPEYATYRSRVRWRMVPGVF